MLLPIKPICNPKKARRDGTSLIYIQYCYNSENKTLLNTEIGIPPKNWNKKRLSISNDLPSAYGDADYLNDELKRLLRIVEDLIRLADKRHIVDKGPFVKETFTPNLVVEELVSDVQKLEILALPKTKPQIEDVFCQINDYIGSKEKKVSEATTHIIRGMREHLRAYQTHIGKNVTFSDFDYSFYENFVDFLTFDYVQKRRNEIVVGLKINTVGKTIKQLRRFLTDRIKRKIIAPIDLSDFKIPTEETDAIYLTLTEINAIYKVDLSNFPHLQPYKDLFVLACLTGLRFSDFSTLQAEDIRNDMLYKKQNKSDHWVVIPLRKEAKKILETHLRDKQTNITNPEFNRHIKTIGNLAGITEMIKFSYKKGNSDIQVIKSKCEWITSHTARRSFCTNEFLAGTPIKLIMKISGHKNEVDFYRYIKITPEEAALKIKQLWMERDSLAALC